MEVVVELDITAQRAVVQVEMEGEEHSRKWEQVFS